jgi:ribonuclease P protein subunit POP4
MKLRIYPHEILGHAVSVIEANNPSIKGMTGLIVEETLRSLLLSTKKGEKRVLKRGLLLKIGEAIVNGDELLRRPEDRIKG